MHLSIYCLPALLTVFALSACSTAPSLSTNDDGPGHMLVPVNHTSRYAPNIFVDDVWAGNVGPNGGGGSALCCLAGRRDWSKPVVVTWEWGYERDRATKAVKLPDDPHSALVHFPRAPKRLNKSSKERWTEEEYLSDELYLCVIFRTLDQVELEFSARASDCPKK